MSGSGMSDNFSCTNPSTISSSFVTNQSHWTIRDDIGRGAIPTAIVLAIMSVTAFLWNLFIIITYCYKYRLLKHPANIFIFVLALSDILVSVAILPAAVVTYSANEFIIGDNDEVRCGYCYFQGFLMIFCPIVSINVLAILSIDRCFLLSNPILYKKKESALAAVIAMVIMVFFSFWLCVLPAFGFGEWEFNRNIAVCTARFTPNRNLLFMLVIVMYLLIPITILGVSNIWTYKIVSKFLRRRLVRRRSYRGSIKEKKEDNVQHHQQQTQLVRVFGALFIANIIIWSPPIIMVLLVFGIGGDSVPGWPWVICVIIITSNTVVHPVLESFFNKELRVAFNKGTARVSKSVRSTSRSLIRMATNQSMKLSALDIRECDSPPKQGNGVNDSNVHNMTETSFVTAMTPDATSSRKTSALTPSPLPTPSAFNYSNNELDKQSPFPSPLPRETPNKKRRQVVISLPDDESVYYPVKERTPTIVQQDTVFEDDDGTTIDDQPKQNAVITTPNHDSEDSPDEQSSSGIQLSDINNKVDLDDVTMV